MEYKILTTAIHTETGEELVIYQETEGEKRVYAKPLSAADGGVQKGEAESLLEQFLDQRTNEERLEFLQLHKADIDGEFLGIVAQSMDFVENGADFELRFQDILKYLRTKIRYESGRMR